MRHRSVQRPQPVKTHDLGLVGTFLGWCGSVVWLPVVISDYTHSPEKLLSRLGRKDTWRAARPMVSLSGPPAS